MEKHEVKRFCSSKLKWQVTRDYIAELNL